ncbi:uncharacterized protein LOC133201653 [Saccostrea echinata]|uniref:uncharacterized protein LOC133201653 n=1 Tax=Saccostrea echinata TaxID=191078 RepID=UPI002A7F93B3|nr:uncharacterized protein LOC133201653 [Saccostrea echinata]
MSFLLFCILSGCLAHACDLNTLPQCVDEKGSFSELLINFQSRKNLTTVDAQNSVNEYCKFQGKLVSCLQDMKRSCVSPNSLSLTLDMRISAEKYLCTEGKQGFIENFQCVMNKFVVDQTSLLSCTQFFSELMEIENRNTGSGDSSKECSGVAAQTQPVKPRSNTIQKVQRKNTSNLVDQFIMLTQVTTCLPNNVPTNLSDGWAGKQRARCVHNPPTHSSGPATDIDMMFLHYFTLGDTFPFP